MLWTGRNASNKCTREAQVQISVSIQNVVATRTQHKNKMSNNTNIF